jgi:hypothetical protein
MRREIEIERERKVAIKKETTNQQAIAYLVYGTIIRPENI